MKTKIKEVVEYQTDSIISKTLLEKKTGSMTLFAFDRGQSLSEHTAPFDAIVQVVEGNVEIRISKKPYNLDQGDMIIMPADEPHSLKAVTQFKMLLTMIKS